MSEAKSNQLNYYDKFIKDNYLEMTIKEMATILYVNESFVKKRMRALGLRKAQFPFIPFPDEEIKDLEGEYKGYQITSYGRVINKQTNTLLKYRYDNNGYVQVRLYINGKPKDVRVHRLVAEYFIPNPDNKPHVNHIDGNKANCHISNLEWVTEKENAQHALRNNLLKIGERHHNAKLTEKEVIEIKRMLHNGFTIDQIIEKVPNATKTIITKIKYNQRWKHLTG